MLSSSWEQERNKERIVREVRREFLSKSTGGPSVSGKLCPKEASLSFVPVTCRDEKTQMIYRQLESWLRPMVRSNRVEYCWCDSGRSQCHSVPVKSTCGLKLRLQSSATTPMTQTLYFMVPSMFKSSKIQACSEGKCEGAKQKRSQAVGPHTNAFTQFPYL